MQKILIVDDDSDLRELYKQSFVNANFEVDTAADVNNALELLRTNKYDAILTDLLFQGMEGVELIKKARFKDSRNIDTPIVILTNLDYGDKTKEALKAGATICLFKAKHTAQSVFKEVSSLLKNNTNNSR